MTVSTSYMSVRSRLLGTDSQNANKKHWDLFSTGLAQHKPVNFNIQALLEKPIDAKLAGVRLGKMLLRKLNFRKSVGKYFCP